MNKIIQGECAQVMEGFEANSIDLTVTSPPYDDMDENFNPLPNGLRDYEGYTWDFKAIAEQLWRVTKEGGVVVWVVNDPTIDGSESLASCYQKIYFRQLGFRVHDTMIYQKAGFTYPDATRYNPTFEYMFVFSKGKPKTLNFIEDKKNKYAGGKIARRGHGRDKDGILTENTAWRNDKEKRVKSMGKRNNIWRYSVGGGNATSDDFAYAHPAIFPEALVRDHILSWSNPGDLVLDPFVGSGTVPKMCIETDRNYIGIDISEEYCELARKRVKVAQPPLFL